MSWYERLSPLDASFLRIESETTHMHVGAVLVFDAQPLTLEHGGIDYDKIRDYVEAVIQKVPRYRQRLATAPLLKHPVWIDDARFNIHYHVRHTSLPRPGTIRQLKRMAGRIFSQSLDRRRPLWELWIVEGLDEGRLAIISKAHHCMIDGISGVDLIAALLRLDQKQDVPKLEPYNPRPAPGPLEIIEGEVRHRVDGQKNLLNTVKGILNDPESWIEKAKEVASGFADTMGIGILPASESPLDSQQLGPNRRFDWCNFDLSRVKQVKNELNGTVNDAVLATVAGGLRRFFHRRGTNPNEIVDYRAMVPISVRGADQRGALGNQVALMLTHLPVHLASARRRFEMIRTETARLKESQKQTHSAELAAELSDVTGGGMMAQTIRLIMKLRPYNIVVTNVPGPPFPLYLLGARMTEIYPMVPLYGDQTVGIALFSYAGSLFWGVTADWQRVPDLHDLIADLGGAFDELRELEPLSS